MNYITAEPFRPFRVRMTSGEIFEIRHPEMIQVGKATATVFTWMNDDREDQKERERGISIILIESIEPLKLATSQDQPRTLAE